jgi:hypothetical protein
MHKSATKCNETLRKWCKNKHGASKIMDTFEMYQPASSTSSSGATMPPPGAAATSASPATEHDAEVA